MKIFRYSGMAEGFEGEYIDTLEEKEGKRINSNIVSIDISCQ
jgi:hypothetical protein